jgi:hypothetical protein
MNVWCETCRATQPTRECSEPVSRRNNKQTEMKKLTVKLVHLLPPNIILFSQNFSRLLKETIKFLIVEVVN